MKNTNNKFSSINVGIDNHLSAFLLFFYLLSSSTLNLLC